MADDRTKEQLDADRNLEEAIAANARAYGEAGLLMEWVVVASHHITGDDGAGYTAVNYTLSDGLPYYRILGLLNFATKRVEKVIQSDDDA